MSNDFRDWVRNVRLRKGLTQDELAEGVGVSQTTVSQWESGRNKPTLANLKALSNFLHEPLDELMVFIGTRPSDEHETETPQSTKTIRRLTVKLELLDVEGLDQVEDYVEYLLSKESPRKKRQARGEDEAGDAATRKGSAPSVATS
jgi:transcriptional regulator with XRE-family HTH domain